MSIRDFADKYSQVWKQAALTGKTDELRQMFDPAFIYHDIMLDAPLDGYLRHLQDIHREAEIIDFELKYLTGDVNLFALDFKARYKFRADIPGKHDIKGKDISTRYLCLFHVRDGIIDEGWSAGVSSENK